MECQMHPVAFDSDCEYCTDERKQMEGNLTSLTQSNTAKEYALHQKGVVMNPAQILQLKLNMFIELMLHGNDKARIVFDTAMQEKMSQILDQTEIEANRQRLLQGVTPKMRR
jgi:hypothetical protein